MSSPAETWLSQGGLYLSSRKVRINEGTERFKSFLKTDPIRHQPKMVFSPKCRGILSELGAGPSPLDGQMHPYKWKTDNDGQVVGEVPVDRYNDGIKAATYWLVDHFGYVQSANRSVIRVRRYA